MSNTAPFLYKTRMSYQKIPLGIYHVKRKTLKMRFIHFELVSESN